MRERGPGRPPASTHDEIRDLALDMFAERGYEKTSLQSIARAAGISRTTLFAYFRSKRDLIWEDYDRLESDVEMALSEGEALPAVDLVLRALLVNARYDVADHATMAARLRLVEQSDELRAYTALRVQDMTRRVSEGVARRVPSIDPLRIDLVTRALVAATSALVDHWAALPDPTDSLDAYVSAGIDPIVDALRSALA